MISMKCLHCEGVDIIINEIPAGRVIICLECGSNHLETPDDPIKH